MYNVDILLESLDDDELLSSTEKWLVKQLNLLQFLLSFDSAGSLMLAIFFVAKTAQFDKMSGFLSPACLNCIGLVAMSSIMIVLNDRIRDHWRTSTAENWFRRMPKWYLAVVKPGKRQVALERATICVGWVVLLCNLALFAGCLLTAVASHHLFIYGVMPTLLVGSAILQASDIWLTDAEFYVYWQAVLRRKKERKPEDVANPN